MSKPLWEGEDHVFPEVHEITVPHLGKVPVVKGNLSQLPVNVQKFVSHYVSSWLFYAYVMCLFFHCDFIFQVSIMQPASIYICDGSKTEYDQTVQKLVHAGIFKKLSKLNEW